MEIGKNPLPIDAQDKLWDFVVWLNENHDVKIGKTALYWMLCHQLANLIKN